MLPKSRDIQVPLLEVLNDIGGQGTTTEIYSLVTKKFSQITEKDLLEKVSKGESKWNNRIRWVRQDLKNKGELFSPKKGIWAITEKGKLRILT